MSFCRCKRSRVYWPVGPMWMWIENKLEFHTMLQNFSWRKVVEFGEQWIDLYRFCCADYQYGIRLATSVDDKVLITLNARNETDRNKFVNDLKEAILEVTSSACNVCCFSCPTCRQTDPIVTRPAADMCCRVWQGRIQDFSNEGYNPFHSPANVLSRRNWTLFERRRKVWLVQCASLMSAWTLERTLGRTFRLEANWKFVNCVDYYLFGTTHVVSMTSLGHVQRGRGLFAMRTSVQECPLDDAASLCSRA